MTTELTPTHSQAEITQRFIPVERIQRELESLLRDFQACGFDSGRMPTDLVLTVDVEDLLLFLEDAQGLPHVYGLTRRLTEAELDAFKIYLACLKYVPVCEAVQLDPDTLVRVQTEEMCFPARLKDVLSHPIII